MPRQRSNFACRECGYCAPKWHGRCPECGSWNSLLQIDGGNRQAGGPNAGASRPLRLADVGCQQDSRSNSGVAEFDRVLGGGIVPGELIMLGGDPGIGKSTLLLQVVAQVALKAPVLYVSGEESARQVRLRAERIGATAPELYILTETNVQVVIQEAKRLRPQVVVIDSIQTAYLESIESSSGSITQLRECTLQLMEMAKSTDIAIFLVGHVTKDGNIAGPRVLEHIVDAVLYMEGEFSSPYRLLRATKNRFGTTDEVGVFEMAPAGLREVANPSAAFLAERVTSASGSAVAVPLEGRRALLVELQALVVPTAFGMPRRTAVGVDVNRLHLVIAVLSKRLGLSLGNQDVFANAVGGLRLLEPACDLGIAAAITSSYRDKFFPADVAFVGEVGLQGEIRPVSQIERRLMEARRMGFTRCVIPAGDAHRLGESNGQALVGATGLRDAFDLIFAA